MGEALDFPYDDSMVEMNEASEPLQERFPMKSPVFSSLAAALGQGAWGDRLTLKPMVGVLFCLCFLSSICAPLLQAQSDNTADGVTMKDGKVYKILGEQLVELEDLVKLPFDVEVNTNGTFKVADGKERGLGEGQIIRSDGWLVGPDGSIQPVFDHVTMQAGRVMVVRDGQAAPLAETMTFPNNLVIQPDGMCTYTQGGTSRLQDGQLFRMDGAGVTAKDAATLKNGRVVVQRGGSLINLNPGQIMGMNDGGRVYGNGQVERRGGAPTQMREGQTVLFDGVPAKH